MRILIHFELRKIFSKKLTEIALIAILLLSVLFGFSTYQNKYAFGGKSDGGTGKTAVEIDKEIAAKYEGILTDEKVQQMSNGMLYAVWAVPVSLIFLGIGIFVSRRAFAKHQVS